MIAIGSCRPANALYMNGHNFKLYRKVVLEMQIRIAVAWNSGDLLEAKRLQTQLVRKYEARALAVWTVITNPGGKTPGVDKVVWRASNDLSEVIVKLRNLRNYKAQPVRRVYIPKSNGSLRPLGIPTCFDRAVQTLWSFALIPIAECSADERSFGFRPHRSTRDAAIWLKNALGTVYAKRFVLEGDIKGFFDTISHKWLLENIPMDPKILGAFLRAGFVDTKGNSKVIQTMSGVPQGGPISPILANMTLDGLEKVTGPKNLTVRYADDFIVLGKTKEELLNEVQPRIAEFLHCRSLELNLAKTHITEIGTGFDFLGFTFREYYSQRYRISKGQKRGVFLITPAKAKIRSLFEKLRKKIVASKMLSSMDLIKQLNPILRGWAQYYKFTSAKATFQLVSHRLTQALVRWGRAKHPKLGVRKVVAKYFTTVGGNRWVFHHLDTDKKVSLRLFQIGYVKIVRYTMCKIGLNAYLPENIAYFTNRVRSNVKHLEDFGISKITLLKQQEGFCPVCSLPIIPEDLVNNVDKHHIISRSNGGNDAYSNLVLLHRHCHKQVTSSKNPLLRAVWIANGIVSR